MSKKITRKEINDLAKSVRSSVYKKIRLPVLLYFSKLNAHEPPSEILRWILIIETTFIITEAPNLASAQNALRGLHLLLKEEFPDDYPESTAV